MVGIDKALRVSEPVWDGPGGINIDDSAVKGGEDGDGDFWAL